MKQTDNCGTVSIASSYCMKLLLVLSNMVVQRNMNRFSIVQIPSDIANKIECGGNGSKGETVVAFLLRHCLFQEMNETLRWLHLQEVSRLNDSLATHFSFPFGLLK